MINHGGSGYRRIVAEISPYRPLTRSPWLPHGVEMNGFLAICGICREIMS
jgi:hypothetical protein